MYRTIISAAVVLLLVFCIFVARQGTPINASADELKTSGFAVVELFTSQGCSSCPPADRLLMTLNKTAQDEQMPVYCLSFHVDYWNQLGWSDPYSRKEFTSRQREYAKTFNTEQVYTPQMIVNGEHEFVGSKADLASKFIAQELSKPATAIVKLDATVEKNRRVSLFYDVDGVTDDSRLNMALVQETVSNAVPRGENKGKSLNHVNVVRAWQTVDLAKKTKGQLTLEMPKDVEPGELAAIAYAQNKTDGRIVGARRIVLDDPRANQIRLTDNEWKQRLTPAQFNITRQKGTEPRGTGTDSVTKKSGVYTCVDCGARLFDASTKFKSGTGWPSFWQPIKDGSAATAPDRSLGMVRTEVKCDRCGAHIGHVFDDGPQPTGQRWCLNATALEFIETGND